MKKSLARAALACGASLAVIHSPHAAEKTSFRLLQMFNDSGHTVPRSGEPYSIWTEGRFSEGGLTDKHGALTTHHRKPDSRQEFVGLVYQFGTYSFVVDSADELSVERLDDWYSPPTWAQACESEKNECKGNGFYWIKLIGRNTRFAGEPYVLTMDGKTHSGQVSQDGYIYVPHDNPAAVSSPMRLKLCAGPALEIAAGRKFHQSSAAPVQVNPRQGPSPSGSDCHSSAVASYLRDNAHLNGGAPYIFSQWSHGLTPLEQARAQEQSAAKKALEEQQHYNARRAANDDPLAWLGPLPTFENYDVEYSQRQGAVIDAIKADVAENQVNIRDFKCKRPQEVGPTPDMDAVEQYLEAFPDSFRDRNKRSRLYAAAEKGNWLAIAQVSVMEAQTASEDSVDSKIRQFRALQLMEWQQKRKIGALYRELDYGLAASGLPSSGLSGILVYAAMHQSYPAQFEVGEALENNSSKALQDIGKRMRSCALDSLPAYKKLLTK